MSQKSRIQSLAIVSIVGIALATPAAAVVATTCAAATSCSLAELSAGSTITVNGIIYSFGNVRTEEFISDFPQDSPPPLGSIIVRGKDADSGKSALSFDLSAQPLFGYDLEGGQQLVFDLAATSATPSSLVIDGGRFSNLLYQVAGDGGELFAYADRLGATSFYNLLNAVPGRITSASNGSAAYPGLDHLYLGVTAGTDGMGDNASSSFSGFDLELAISPIAPVPLPAALPLLVAGLGCIGLIGRRRRRS